MSVRVIAKSHVPLFQGYKVNTAIGVADSLPPCGIRPVFVFRLKDFPAEHPILLGAVGESAQEAELLLRDRFGDRLLNVALYIWPPVLPCVH